MLENVSWTLSEENSLALITQQTHPSPSPPPAPSLSYPNKHRHKHRGPHFAQVLFRIHFFVVSPSLIKLQWRVTKKLITNYPHYWLI